MQPTSTGDWLLVSAIFSCILLVTRMLVTGSFAFIFLPWNLFLAFIPYWISTWAVKNPRKFQSAGSILVLFSVWLLFIPNSFYIITDLFHLEKGKLAPRWFDLLLIFSFAINGLMCGILSLNKMEKIFQYYYKRKFSFRIVFILMWLIAFGIYIGRYMRFNSWDIVTDPFSLFTRILEMIFNPFEYWYVWGMTFCYSIFMTLFYYMAGKSKEAEVTG